ncbi:MAG: hypothetical protein KatS3mg014_1011 [Actinomycetota bacterium]|nr:MAG: hypothetical protein KatS3mg014_1011 [Actinomycetota bacterium]
MPRAPTTASASAPQIGQTPATRPAPTPAKARCPIPSPISAIRFCTTNVPTSGANTPTMAAATSARCMNASSNG